MAALPPGEPAGHLFKAIFLHRVPRDLKDLVAVQFQQLAPMELAKFADVIWDARNSKKTVVAAISLAAVEEETSCGEETALEKAVAALTIHNKLWWRGGTSRGSHGGSRAGGQSQRALCGKHERFGANAYFCSSPKTCTWLGNT